MLPPSPTEQSVTPVFGSQLTRELEQKGTSDKEILQTVVATTLAAISLTTVTFESAQAQTQPQISLSNYAAPLSENQKHELMSDIANVEMSLNPQLVRQLFELQPLFGEDVALLTQYSRPRKR